MSHVHPHSGNANLAAEYQEYLARLAADRRLPRPGQNPKRFEVKTFDSAIEEPDEGSEEDEDGQADTDCGREADDPPTEDATDQPGFSTKA